MPNFILSEYLIDDKWVYPLSVNFSYRQARQSNLLITNAYIYICYRSTFSIDKSITYQDTEEERFS